MDKKTQQELESDIERFRFELAEELGIIEQADSGKKSRASVMTFRPPVHKHIKKRP